MDVPPAEREGAASPTGRSSTSTTECAVLLAASPEALLEAAYTARVTRPLVASTAEAELPAVAPVLGLEDDEPGIAGVGL